jgi:hypothetical protein
MAECDSAAAAAAALVAVFRLLVAAGATFPMGRSAGHSTSPSEFEGDEADEEEEDTGSEDRRDLALVAAAGTFEEVGVRLGGASELSEESMGDGGPLSTRWPVELDLLNDPSCWSPHNFAEELARICTTGAFGRCGGSSQTPFSSSDSQSHSQSASSEACLSAILSVFDRKKRSSFSRVTSLFGFGRQSTTKAFARGGGGALGGAKGNFCWRRSTLKRGGCSGGAYRDDKKSRHE